MRRAGLYLTGSPPSCLRLTGNGLETIPENVSEAFLAAAAAAAALAAALPAATAATAELGSASLTAAAKLDTNTG